MPPSFTTTSPCSVLYDDVLREIFITCCIHGPENLSEPLVVGSLKPSIRKLPQLSVSRVCHSWRHVALCTRQLWNNIMIQEFTKANLSLARKYLSRAENLPVSITFGRRDETDEQDWRSQMTDFLSSYRLRILTVHSKMRSFYLVLPDLPQRSVADLETLMIFNNRNTQKGSIDLNDIRYPKLTVFHIWGIHNISVFSTSLRIFDGTLLPMTVPESWDFLSHCPSLEEANLLIQQYDNTSRRPDSVPLIQLQHLRVLDFDSEPLFMDKSLFNIFIEALALPIIEKLWVSHTWVSSTAFQSLASRSNYFPYLSNIRLKEPTSIIDTGALLASIPSLKNMVLFWINNDNDVIFDHLVLDGLASGSLAPRLQSLRVGYISNEGEFMDMVELRMKNAQMSSDVVPAPFTEVQYFSRGNHETARLRDMQQRGIPIGAIWHQ